MIVDLPTLGMPTIMALIVLPSRCGTILAAICFSLRIVGTSSRGDRMGADTSGLLEVGSPGRGHGVIGKIAFRQDLQAGFVAAQFGQHRILTGIGNSCVQDFDDHVHFGERRLHFKPSFVHVAWEPLDWHVFVAGSR